MRNNVLYITVIMFLAALLSAGCKDEKYQGATVYQGGIGDAILLASDTIGKEVRMEIIQGNCDTSTREVYAIVFNPQKKKLSYGRSWELE